MKIKSVQKNKQNFSGINVTDIAKEINSNMPRAVRFLNKFKNHMGEGQDIIVNAIGTGIVAPIFIKYNGLSRADENTKTYSALRQTAMGAIAVLVQAGITVPANKYIDRLASEGNLGEKFNPKILKNVPNITAFKRIANLGLAFFTIPFSCWLLNKTYPKFMQKFMPSVSRCECDGADKAVARSTTMAPLRRSASAGAEQSLIAQAPECASRCRGGKKWA